MQGYTNLEHIVIDDDSTDGTPAILVRYPHLKAISEPDQGQADAVNKGLRRVGGGLVAS